MLKIHKQILSINFDIDKINIDNVNPSREKLAEIDLQLVNLFCDVKVNRNNLDDPDLPTFKDAYNSIINKFDFVVIDFNKQYPDNKFIPVSLKLLNNQIFEQKNINEIKSKTTSLLTNKRNYILKFY